MITHGGKVRYLTQPPQFPHQYATFHTFLTNGQPSINESEGNGLKLEN